MVFLYGLHCTLQAWGTTIFANIEIFSIWLFDWPEKNVRNLTEPLGRGDL